MHFYHPITPKIASKSDNEGVISGQIQSIFLVKKRVNGAQKSDQKATNLSKRQGHDLLQNDNGAALLHKIFNVF